MVPRIGVLSFAGEVATVFGTVFGRNTGVVMRALTIGSIAVEDGPDAPPNVTRNGFFVIWRFCIHEDWITAWPAPGSYLLARASWVQTFGRMLVGVDRTGPLAVKLLIEVPCVSDN